MKRIKSYLVLIIGVIFLLSVTLAFAGDRSGTSQMKSTKNKSNVTEQKSSHEIEMIQEQKQEKEQTMEQKQENEQICFETKDGKTFIWQNRYNKRLMRYEEKKDTEKMKRYLYRIAKRMGIKDLEEIEEFVQWAMKVKPWIEIEVEVEQ